jgi:hypothetical protein
MAPMVSTPPVNTCTARLGLDRAPEGLFVMFTAQILAPSPGRRHTDPYCE